jgi:hypothetical protein
VGECGGPTDILGDVFQNGNCYSQELLYFNVPSYTAGTSGAPTSLTVLSVSPANGATNVRRDQSVSVTFSNPINNSTTGGYNTQLYAGQDLQTNGSVTMSADGRTMTFNIGALNNGTTYTIAIPAGGVTDDWGNSLAAPFISTFTTMADPATGNGSVQSTNPGNTSGVPTNTLLTLYMNRQVNASTVPGSLTVTVNGQVYSGTTAGRRGGGYEIQYTPTTAFPNSAAVQWFLSGNVQDVYGDLFNGASGYFYTVAAPVRNPATAQPHWSSRSAPIAADDQCAHQRRDRYSVQRAHRPTTLTTSNVYLNSGPATPYTVALAPGTNKRRAHHAQHSVELPSTWYGFCTNANVKGTNGVAAQSDCWATYFTTTAAARTRPPARSRSDRRTARRMWAPTPTSACSSPSRGSDHDQFDQRVHHHRRQRH